MMKKNAKRIAKPRVDNEYLARELREMKRVSYASLIISLAALSFVVGVLVRYFLF